MAEEFGFQKLFRQRRAVDLDERLGAAPAQAVQGPGHQFLARAAGPAHEHGHAGVGQGADALEDPEHGRAFADEFAVLALAAQPGVFALEVQEAEKTLHEQQQPVAREGLAQEVEGSGLDGLHRQFDLRVGRDEHDPCARVEFMNCFKQFHAVHARQAQVGDDQIEGPFAQEAQSCFGLPGGGHVIALAGQGVAACPGAWSVRPRRAECISMSWGGS